MNDENIEELVQHYLEKRENGMEITQMRKELESHNLDSATTSLIIRRVDNIILGELRRRPTRNELKMHRRSNGLFDMISGAVMLFGSIFLMLYMYYHNSSYIVAYGLMGAGLALIIKGWNNSK
ncbi:MAG: hypothetical protein H6607_11580 [Flavobacteriales bacterium]|nr:hypothetical protein [Flavobacteriales bacterium]